MTKKSNVQQSIENTLRVHGGNAPKKADRPSSLVWVDYGMKKYNNGLNHTHLVECGSCDKGQLKKTADRLPQECSNCHGKGWRMNTRYGRCGKGRWRKGQEWWAMSKQHAETLYAR